jgi:hypothetical protein
MRLGDEVTPCQRIQFKCGTYPDAETNGGGMNETALVDFFAGIISAEPAAAEGQAGWISVDDRMPELGVLVFGLTEGGALSVFCRDDGGGEGWLWAQQHWAWNIAAPEGIECDDDYDVKFWRPMFAAPLPSGQQEGGKR